MTVRSRAWQAVAGAYLDAVAALDPARLVADAVNNVGEASVHVFAVGKAAGAMAAGAHQAFGSRLADGFAVTVAGDDRMLPACLPVRVSSHPVPDERSLAAAEELLLRVAAVPASSVIVFLLSGGASSLCAAPAWGLSLADKSSAIAALVAGGESIFAINTVRKHLSRIKGGRLAQASTAPVHALVLSDVLDNDLSTVGSGPFFPDPTTFADALDIVGGYELAPSVTAALKAGRDGQHPETVKPGAACFARVSHRVVAGPDDLLAAAVRSLEKSALVVEAVAQKSCTVAALADRLSQAAHTLSVQVARDGVGRALALSGEPTLQLGDKGTGRGGRAQHTALSVAVALDDMTLPDGVDVEVLCAGSDGIDGPTDAAGAIVNAGSVGRTGGVDARAALASFDSYRALFASGDLWQPGPTQNNLCDLYIVAVCAQR